MCYAQQVIGQKQYEITDHLGDVLATVSDKRAADSVLGAHVTGQIDTIITWKPVVASATDYYPFGMQMPGRYTSDTATHCFDITQTKLVPYFYSQYFLASDFYFGATAHSTANLTVLSSGELRMNIWNAGYVTMNIDSLVPGYTQTLSIDVTGSNALFDVLISSGGTVVGSAIVGGLPGTANITITPGAGTAIITVQRHAPSSGTPKFVQFGDIYLPRSDSSILENVVTTVCDGDKYQYGYNGQMKDNEWAGAGNHYEYGVRHYDPRIARFNSIDPLGKQFPWYSSYQFAGNTPIQAIDLDGAEEYHYTRMRDNSGKTTGIQLNSVKDIYSLNLKATFSASLGAGTMVPIYDKNPYQSHVVHQTDTKYMDNVYGLMQETNYPESTSYPSYKAAANGSDADFNGTSADVGFWLQQGLNNVGEEVRSNGGPIVSGSKSQPEITVPYKRPNNATTPAQRASVQGKPCVSCGQTANPMVANHIVPLVEEYYTTGTIDLTKMRDVKSVNPQCPTCSARQGAELRQYGQEQKAKISSSNGK
ncbi:MAG: hypothetical protein K0Q79_1651 [Flavipsychrobacter sp.]|jgi:RHS repeat-associated protein|nr:hypothetical protein [Flavipsychrobacter sp.]